MPEMDAPLQDSATIEPDDVIAETPARPPKSTDEAKINPSSQQATLLALRSQADVSDSESEDEISLNKDNENWASLMLQLDNLRIAAGQTKKARKGKTNGIILETPEMRALQEKVKKVEKEYMFSRKDAGSSLIGDD